MTLDLPLAIGAAGFLLVVIGHVVTVTWLLAKINTRMEGLKEDSTAIREEMHQMNRSLTEKIEKNERKLNDLHVQTSDLRVSSARLATQIEGERRRK